MQFATWCLFIGGLLILVGLSSTRLKSLPISAAALYMAIGFAVGPGGSGLIDLNLKDDAHFVEVVTEIGVLVSLFVVGLRLQLREFDQTWWVPISLATVAMVLTIGMMTAAGLTLHWSLASALLLAAVLAPTDPVLASEVQVKHEKDRDELRFGLTVEGGLNDGAAFPFVMLALGLFGVHDLGQGGSRWIGMDLLWAVVGGLALGWLSGASFTRLVIFLRHRKHQALGMESFLALGLIALTYGVALYASVYGFLAVFMAGLSMRDVATNAAEQAPGVADANPDAQPDEPGEAGVPDPQADAGAASAASPVVEAAKASTKMTQLVLSFAQDLEKFVELAAMLIIGSLLSSDMLTPRNFAVAALLIFVARPLAVYLATAFSRWTPTQRRLGAWFGVRGVGSLYYLAYAATHGAATPEFESVANAVLLTVAMSVLLHGVSATPLMAIYQRQREGR